MSQPMFALLPTPRPPLMKALVSMGLEVLAGLLVFGFGLLRPIVYQSPERDYHVIALVDVAPPVLHEPQPVRRLVMPPPVAQIREPIPQNRQLPPLPPKPKEEIAPQIQVAAKRPEIAPPPVMIPREPVRTNVFSTGSSAPPTIVKPPQQVQTGGFGDPNGLPAQDSRNKPVNIAQVGSFDLPAGAGSGNGTGGAKGARGVVASSGFGNGVATGDGHGRVSAPRTPIQVSGFGEMQAATTVVKAAKIEAAPKIMPVEILSKPRPIYTEEARRQRVEGEVLLEVVFEASGRIRILRIVRGLGFGLDDAAMRAAEKIQFKPAKQAGQATDSTAILHIIFQLA